MLLHGPALPSHLILLYIVKKYLAVEDLREVRNAEDWAQFLESFCPQRGPESLVEGLNSELLQQRRIYNRFPVTKLPMLRRLYHSTHARGMAGKRAAC